MGGGGPLDFKDFPLLYLSSKRRNDPAMNFFMTTLTCELLLAAYRVEDEEAHVILDYKRQHDVHGAQDEGDDQTNLTERNSYRL